MQRIKPPRLSTSIAPSGLPAGGERIDGAVSVAPAPAAKATDASRRRSALDGLRRYFRDQDAQRRAGTPRPTMPVAEMTDLIRGIASKIEGCRHVRPLPTIRDLDADGCNWDMPAWPGQDDRSADCAARMAGAIENLRARYNLS